MIPYNPISLGRVLAAETEARETTTTHADARGEAADVQFNEIYFGYASNLSWRTMKQRCPDCLFVGLARLDGWKWVINSTRYANIIRSPGDIVYGSLVFLSARDETALDESEGVPWNYQKLQLTVTRLQPDGSEMLNETNGQPEVATALAYVDERRTETDGTIEPDYVVLVNKAIYDGVECGLPQEYINKYLRAYTPLPSAGEEITMVRTMKRFDLRTPQAPPRPE